jgi:hypothetical protein
MNFTTTFGFKLKFEIRKEIRKEKEKGIKTSPGPTSPLPTSTYLHPLGPLHH